MCSSSGAVSGLLQTGLHGRDALTKVQKRSCTRAACQRDHHSNHL